MIRITDLKIPVDHYSELKSIISKKLRVSEADIKSVTLKRRSLDARKKSEILFVITADIELAGRNLEKTVMRNARKFKLSIPNDKPYQFPYKAKNISSRPVIIGMGPAGLFSAYELALAGFAPIVIERGAPVDERAASIEEFWESGKLDTETNVCFGEGGAGAFSDGKLNSSSTDPHKRNSRVLETFVKYGADEDILSWYRPHIGTDVLRTIIKNMREAIISNGGEIRFHCRFDEFIWDDKKDKIKGIRVISSSGQSEAICCDTVILAIGHSASDTFKKLYNDDLYMTQKPFAVGYRIQHPQKLINERQYGSFEKYLPAAEYKLTSKTSCGRGVYSFCMCPGGYVVNSSSEEGYLSINGMSYHDRSGVNANSAILVTVGSDDFAEDVLAGLEFQKQIERKAFEKCRGKIPVQTLGDFAHDVDENGNYFHAGSEDIGDVIPQIKGQYEFSSLKGILPSELEKCILEGLSNFNKKIPGFGNPKALLAGIESRTSSPIKIPRDDNGFASVNDPFVSQKTVTGLFPCGEGAGYAGGIMSAAVDGIITAERAAAYILHGL